MKRLSMILLGVLTLPAYGNIASQEYVDAQIGEVSKTIESKAKKSGYTENMLLQTDTDGKLTATTLKTNMIENGAVTNSKLASNIGLDKLDMGTLPTSGKHILIWNSGTNKYVFEEFIKPATGLQCDATSSGCVTDEWDGTTCDKYPEYDIGFGQCIDSGVKGGSYTEDVSTMTWSTTFSYGTISGSALCSSTSGTYGVAGEPDETPGSGGYCWCKMTSPAASRWVFISGRVTGADNCAYNCADDCGLGVRQDSGFRSGVFSSVGN